MLCFKNSKSAEVEKHCYLLSAPADLKLGVPDPLLERGLELDVGVEGGDPLRHGVHVVRDLLERPFIKDIRGKGWGRGSKKRHRKVA